MSREPDEALEVLRGIWTAQGQTSVDPDEPSHGHGRACKRMANVGFDGITGDGEDLHAAWRSTLEREGKLNPDGATVKYLIFGPSDSA